MADAALMAQCSLRLCRVRALCLDVHMVNLPKTGGRLWHCLQPANHGMPHSMLIPLWGRARILVNLLCQYALDYRGAAQSALPSEKSWLMTLQPARPAPASAGQLSCYAMAASGSKLQVAQRFTADT